MKESIDTARKEGKSDRYVIKDGIAVSEIFIGEIKSLVTTSYLDKPTVEITHVIRSAVALSRGGLNGAMLEELLSYIDGAIIFQISNAAYVILGTYVYVTISIFAPTIH